MIDMSKEHCNQAASTKNKCSFVTLRKIKYIYELSCGPQSTETRIKSRITKARCKNGTWNYLDIGRIHAMTWFNCINLVVMTEGGKMVRWSAGKDSTIRSVTVWGRSVKCCCWCSMEGRVTRLSFHWRAVRRRSTKADRSEPRLRQAEPTVQRLHTTSIHIHHH